MERQLLHLSSLAGSPLVDRRGERLGRVRDLIVRVDATDEHPPVIGLQAHIGGRDLFVPIAQVASLEDGRAQLAGESLHLQRFERRPGELLLRNDVLGRKLAHVEEACLVTAHEIDLAHEDGDWRVAGIDTGARGLVRRLLPRRLADRVDESSFIDWRELELLVGHVPQASRLRVRPRRLATLHPAQIADLVEAASHDEGEEIIKAVGHDRELEADVFEELDDEHQLEFIRERPDADVAAVLSKMASDDAADLIAQLPEERAQAVLTLLAPGPQRHVRSLLGYNPETAGGVMGTDFVSVPHDATVADARERVRESSISAQALGGVFLESENGELAGSLLLVELLRADGDKRLDEIADLDPPSVEPDVDLPEVARTMSDFNLTVLPVVEARRIVGVITVDDVIELVLPAGWRRRYGIAGR